MTRLILFICIIIVFPIFSQAQRIIVGWEFPSDNTNNYGGECSNSNVTISTNNWINTSVACDNGQELQRATWASGLAWTSSSFSTLGFENITISFWNKSYRYGPGGTWKFEYNIGNGWVTVLNYTQVTSNNCSNWVKKTNEPLPEEVANQPSVQIRWKGGGTADGGNRLDNVFVKGTRACDITINSVLALKATCPNTPNARIIIEASCPSCCEIWYSIEDNNIWQTNKTFKDLSVGNYQVRVRDRYFSSCTVSYADNPVSITSEPDGPPTAICNDYTLQLDNSGNGTLTEDNMGGNSYDDCQISSWALTKTSFSCSDIGSETVSLTITDSGNATSSCSATITVVDENAPKITCPNNIVTNSDPSVCSAVVSYNIPVGTDECEGVATQKTEGIDSGSIFPIGINTVTYLSTDSEGNTATCSFTITVNDNQAPNALCRDIVKLLDDSGQVNITTDEVNNLSTDNCSVVSLSLSNHTFNCTQVGLQSVELTVADEANNTSTCQSLVTIQDNTPPTALCQDLTVVLDGNGSATITTTQINTNSTDNCGLSYLGLNTTSFDCNTIGENTVTLTIIDESNLSNTCTANVTVQDIPPLAICKDITANLDNNGTVAIASADIDNGSSDNCGIATLVANPNSFDCTEVGSQTITLTITDNNDLSSTCIATVFVQDETAPAASCQNITVNLDPNGDSFVSGSQVGGNSSDNCGINTLEVLPNTFNLSSLGDNNVTLTVTDDNALSTSCTAVVTIVNTNAPNPICQAHTIVLDANGTASLDASDIDGGSTALGGITSISANPNTFTCTDLGPNTVTLTILGNNGESASCQTTVMVNDDLSPVALCQDITVNLDANGNQSITANQIDNGSSDICGIAYTDVTPTDFDCTNVGGNTLTLTVTDNYGNTATCTATALVRDFVLPNMICQNTSVNLDASGNASLTAAQVDNGSSDACGIASLIISPNIFTCSDVGVQTVTLSSTDINNNTNQCTAMVMVSDNTAPTTLCRDVIANLDEVGDASITAGQIDNGSFDNCNISSVSATPTDFVLADLGPNKVVLTVTDSNDNTATCSAQVTVENNQLPNAVCKNTTVQLDENGEVSLALDDIDGGSTALGGIASRSISKDFLTCADLGNVGITLTITGTNTLVAACNATVTVEDNIPPTLVCHSPVITFNGEADIALSVADVWDEASSTDNCSNLTFVGISPSLITCDQVGSIVPVEVTIEDENGSASSCTALVDVLGLPCDWSSTPDGIGCTGGNASSYDSATGTFTINSEGCYESDFYNNSDSNGYIAVDFCGDGEVVAQITNLTGSLYAGVMMRETLNPDAKMLQIMVNNSGIARRELRSSTGATAYAHQFQNQGKFWVKITRSGNQFASYLSLNGIQWDLNFLTQIPMSDCIKVGLVTMNESAVGAAVATFNNVNIPGFGGNSLQAPSETPLEWISHSTQPADFSMYPNPSSGNITLELSAFFDKKVQVNIYNHLGQLVKHKQLEEVDNATENMDLSAMSAGAYIVEVISNTQRITKKLVLSKL